MAKDDKPKTQSGTPAGTGKTTGIGTNLEDLIKAYSSMGGVVSEGPTAQDAEAAVQSVYSQLLGRNAAGAERSRAISAYLNQSAGTDASGRQQAVISLIQQSPEFRKRQENNYLDAIYNEVAKNVQRTQR
jgi:hypothetical protein